MEENNLTPDPKGSEVKDRYAGRPWMRRYYGMNSRCRNKNSPSYAYYGGKGIKAFLSLKDMEFLWKRDKADLLKRPSIDRIDPKGHYVLENCRFIELSENSSRAHANKPTCKRGHIFKGQSAINKTKGKYFFRKCRTCTNIYNREWMKRARKKRVQKSFADTFICPRCGCENSLLRRIGAAERKISSYCRTCKRKVYVISGKPLAPPEKKATGTNPHGANIFAEKDQVPPEEKAK